jgi:hypothetical protein
MEKLVKYKEEKLEIEQQLTGRFLAVLNAKKEHIQQLEERLQGMVIVLLQHKKLANLMSGMMVICMIKRAISSFIVSFPFSSVILYKMCLFLMEFYHFHRM